MGTGNLWMNILKGMSVLEGSYESWTLQEWVTSQIGGTSDKVEQIINESNMFEFKILNKKIDKIQELIEENKWIVGKEEILKFRIWEMKWELELVFNSFFWDDNISEEDLNNLWKFIKIVSFIWDKLRILDSSDWLSEEYKNSNSCVNLWVLSESKRNLHKQQSDIKFRLTPCVNLCVSKSNSRTNVMIQNCLLQSTFRKHLKPIIKEILLDIEEINWTDIIDLCGKLKIINDELKTL